MSFAQTTTNARKATARLARRVARPRRTANLRRHLGVDETCEFTRAGGYEKTCDPGRVVSFRPGRNAVIDRLKALDAVGCHDDDELIPLRDEESSLED